MFLNYLSTINMELCLHNFLVHFTKGDRESVVGILFLYYFTFCFYILDELNFIMFPSISFVRTFPTIVKTSILLTKV